MVDTAIGLDVFFLLMGAILVFSMHGGFAFLELGTVRGKNQVNAMVKIIVDFAFSTLAYFFIGYWIAYGVTFFVDAQTLSGAGGGFRAAGHEPGQILLPRDLRRRRPRHHFGRHRRAREILAAGRDRRADRRADLSLLRGHRLERQLRHPGLVRGDLRRPLPRFRRLDRRPRRRRLAGAGRGAARSARAPAATAPTAGRSRPRSIPWLGLGTWLLCIGWFGFNVMSAQSTASVSGPRRAQLAAGHGRRHRRRVDRRARPTPASSTMARWRAWSRSAPAPTSCTRSARWWWALVAGVIFVRGFTFTQEKLKIDDVLGVWPLHGLCGLWGGIACGIFGLEALGGMGGVSFHRPARRLGRRSRPMRWSPASSSTPSSSASSASA